MGETTPMASSWGEQLKITLFGESHGPAVGVVIDGVPAGETLDPNEIQRVMARRSPGRNRWSSARSEEDSVTIVSGWYQGQTTGTPLCMMIANKDARSKDYEKFSSIPRPSHADYTGLVRFRGAADPRGGGHFSGRLTAPLCAAGAICKQMLERRGVEIFARVAELGGVPDAELDTANPDIERLRTLSKKEFPVLDDLQGEKMLALVEDVRTKGDSVGGVIQCLILGLPAGLGDPIFGGVESRLASLLYGIPAVKAVSFGDGFAVARRLGSENNDPLYLDDDGQVRTATNHEGGLNGGVTNGMPVVFQIAIKPTPSIALQQRSVNMETGTEELLTIEGRHDPCIVPRAVVAVEAAAAIAMTDLMLVAFGVQGWGGKHHGRA